MSRPTATNRRRPFRLLVAALAATLVVGVLSGAAGVFAAAPAGAAGAATRLAYTTNPTAVAAGNVMTAPVVQLRDSLNNNVLTAGVSVSVAVNTGPGIFDGSATTTVDTNASGQAVFSNLVFDTSGSYTLMATSEGLATTTSGSFSVSAGTATQLALSNVPATVVSGAAVGITATLQDVYGNTETTTSTGTVALSLDTGPAGGAVAGTFSRTLSGGVATFTQATLTLVGTYTLDATYAGTLSGVAGATSSAISVSAGAAKKLVFTQGPSATTAGAVMSPAPVARVTDTNGNPVADSGVTVTLSSSGALTAGSTKSVTTDVNGAATFSNLTWNTAGTYTIATSASGLTSSGNSASFAISPGVATQLVFSTQPTSTPAGSVVSTTVVKIEDAVNNVLTTSSDDVTLSPNGNGGFGPASTATVAAVNGVATFSNLILDTSGSYTLSASSPDGAVGTSKSFTVSPLAATQLVFGNQPVDNTAGTVQATKVTVQAEDGYGNVATTTGTVTLTSSPGVTLTSGAAGMANGVATFNSLSLQTAGTYTLTATLAGLTSAPSSSFTISPNVAYQLVWGVQPTAITVGQVISPAPTVLVEDHFGNVEAADNTDTVTLSTSVGFDPASTTSEVVVDGVATFDNLSLDTVGNVNHTLTPTLSPTAVAHNPVSAAFATTPGAPYRLAIMQPQLGGQVGTGNSIGTFYLEQYDAYGNNTWGDVGTPLTFSSSSPGGTFSLTDNGPSTTTATFNYPPNGTSPPNNRDFYFYYGDTQVGLPTITVSSPGVISATQQVEIIDVDSPGDQTDSTGAAITPLQMTGQNSSPAYPFTSWSATGLPDGLSIDPTSGIVTGQPTAVGTYSVEVYGNEGTYAWGYAGFAWTVDNAVSVSGPGDQSSVPGTAIAPVTVTGTDSGGEALTYADNGTLPPGLAIDASSGVISGTPTTTGSYPVTITATDTDGYSGTAGFTWTVANGANAPTVTLVHKSSGPAAGNVKVKITGTGLTGATEVLFGATPGTDLHWNRKGTKLVVRTPAHAAGTVDVTVLTPQGQSTVSGSDQYTFDGAVVTSVTPSSGPPAGGTSVAIHGTGFKGATEVLFGMTPATFTAAASGKKVTTVAPAGTGQVDITVVTPGGTSAVTPADGYTYVAPTVTGVTPATGPAAGGKRVVVSGTGLTGATEVYFGTVGVAVGKVTGGGTKVTVQSPAQAAGPVDVTVVTPSGTTAVNGSDTYTYS